MSNGSDVKSDLHGSVLRLVDVLSLASARRKFERATSSEAVARQGRSAPMPSWRCRLKSDQAGKIADEDVHLPGRFIIATCAATDRQTDVNAVSGIASQDGRAVDHRGH